MSEKHVSIKSVDTRPAESVESVDTAGVTGDGMESRDVGSMNDIENPVRAWNGMVDGLRSNSDATIDNTNTQRAKREPFAKMADNIEANELSYSNQTHSDIRKISPKNTTLAPRADTSTGSQSERPAQLSRQVHFSEEIQSRRKNLDQIFENSAVVIANETENEASKDDESIESTTDDNQVDFMPATEVVPGEGGVTMPAEVAEFASSTSKEHIADAAEPSVSAVEKSRFETNDQRASLDQTVQNLEGIQTEAVVLPVTKSLESVCGEIQEKLKTKEHYRSKNRELGEKVLQFLPNHTWRKRFGLAALLGLLGTVPTGNGEKDAHSALLNTNETVDMQQAFRELASNTTEWRRGVQEKFLELQNTPVTYAGIERSSSKPEVMKTTPALEVPVMTDTLPAFAVTSQPAEWEPTMMEEKEETDIYRIPKGCTLMFVMEGKSTPPQTETLARAAATSPQAMTMLMGGIINELKEQSELARAVGIKEQFLDTLFLDAGQEFTEDNLAALESVAKRVADQLEIFDNHDLDSYLSEKSVPTPEEDLKYGDAQSEIISDSSKEEDSQHFSEKGLESSDEVRWLEIPQKDVYNQSKEITFSSTAYGDLLGGGKTIGIRLGAQTDLDNGVMTRVDYLKRAQEFEVLTKDGRNPEIMQAMGVREKSFEEVQPGDKIDITLWREFMLDPTINLKALKAKAEAYVNRNR